MTYQLSYMNPAAELWCYMHWCKMFYLICRSEGWAGRTQTHCPSHLLWFVSGWISKAVKSNIIGHMLREGRALRGLLPLPHRQTSLKGDKVKHQSTRSSSGPVPIWNGCMSLPSSPLQSPDLLINVELKREGATTSSSPAGTAQPRRTAPSPPRHLSQSQLAVHASQSHRGLQVLCRGVFRPHRSHWSLHVWYSKALYKPDAENQVQKVERFESWDRWRFCLKVIAKTV